MFLLTQRFGNRRRFSLHSAWPVPGYCLLALAVGLMHVEHPACYGQAAAATKTPSETQNVPDDRVTVKDFPILKGASSLTFDAAKQEVRFKTGTQIAAIAEFYQDEMKSRGWEVRFESVASFFANLRFRKDGKGISINAKRDLFGKIATVTISGDGLLWDAKDASAGAAQRETGKTSDQSGKIEPSGASEKDGASAESNTIKASDFPLLDAQSTSHEGSMEIIRFNSRKGVPENVAFHTGGLTAKGWKRTVSSEHDGLHLLRFEKGDVYIRIALWPHDFSDNAGEYKGAMGAAEGTGLAWSGSDPSGGVPERMLSDYEKMLGRLTPEAREKFKNSIRKARERALTGGREVPADAWKVTSDQPAGGDKPAPQQQEKKDAARDKQKPGKTIATFVVNSKTYNFKHAVAFQGYWFDEKVPTVLFSEKPIPLDRLKAALRKGFDGQEMFTLRLGRHLIIRHTSADKPTVGGWADNLSLGGSSDLESEIRVDEGRIRGKVAMPKADQLGPFTYRFEAEFDLELAEFE